MLQQKKRVPAEGYDGSGMKEKKKCFRDFVRYSAFNVLGMIGLSCYILADTYFVSRGLGADGLTALNLAIPIYSFIHGSGLMVGMGGGIKYSIQRSLRNSRRADGYFTNAVKLAVLLALFFLLTGVFFSERLAFLVGADETVFWMTKTYLQVILLFSPVFLMNNVLLCFVRNDGAPKLVMLAMLAGSFSNVILDYIFIFPCRMGIFGAVLATGFAPVISMLVLLRHFLKKKNQFHFVKCRMGAKEAAEILSGGIPSLVTEVSSGVVILVFNAIILKLQGNVGVAAYGVIANLSLVVVSIYTGLGQGIQPILSKNHGAGCHRNVRTILRYALITVLLFSAVIYMSVFFGAAQIAGIFNSEKNAVLQRIAEEGLKYYFTACPFAGFNIIISIYFTSTEYPAPAHVISVLRGFAVMLPMVWLLSSMAGMAGVWWAFPATELLVAVIGGGVYLTHSGRRSLG